MPVDLMLDQTTGDLVATAGNDVAIVSGTAEVEQRIRTHLMVQLGTYQLDTTLGSTMNSLLRLQASVVVAQLPLTVKEALAQMEDIQVQDVEAWLDPNDARVVRFTVTYSVVDSGSEDVTSYQGSVIVGGG